MKKYFLFLFLISISVSCKNNSELAIMESVSYDGNSTLKFEDVISECEMIPIKLNDQLILNEDVELLHLNNLFYLIDYEVNGKIIVLNNLGEFQNSIGGKGKGNGEYLNMQDYRINNDTISIFSNISDEEYKYLKSGEFLGKNKMSTHFNKISFLEDGRTFLYIGYDAGDEKNRVLEFTNGEIKNKFLNSTAKILSFMEFLPTIIPYKDGIIVRESISNVLYFINGDNTTSVFCKFDYGDAGIPEDYFKKSDAMEAAMYLMSKDYMYNGRLLMNDNFMILQALLNSVNGNTSSYAIKDLKNGKWNWINYGKSSSLNTLAKGPKYIDKDNYLYFIVNKEICDNLVSQNKVNIDTSANNTVSDLFILKCKLKL